MLEWIAIMIIYGMNAYIINFWYSSIMKRRDISSKVFYGSFIAIYGIVYLLQIIELTILSRLVLLGGYIALVFIIYQGEMKQRFVAAVGGFSLTFIGELATVFILGLQMEPKQLEMVLGTEFLYALSGAISQLVSLVIIMIVAKFIYKEQMLLSVWQLASYLAVPISSIFLLKGIFMTGYHHGNMLVELQCVLLGCLIVSAANIVVFENFYGYSKAQTEVKRLALNQQRMEINQHYYSILDYKYRQNRKIIHDINNHLACISGLAQKGDKGQILDYVRQIHHGIGDLVYQEITGNPVLDIILNQKAMTARESSVAFSIDSYRCDIGKINDVHLCTMVGNLLDNAIEAAKKSERKWVDFEVYSESEGFLVIELRNSCDVIPIIDNGRLVSTKKDKENHGIGMGNVSQVVKSYQGELEFDYSEKNKEFATLVKIKNNIEVDG